MYIRGTESTNRKYKGHMHILWMPSIYTHTKPETGIVEPDALIVG